MKKTASNGGGCHLSDRYGTLHSIDEKEIRRRARGMENSSLEFSANDAAEAAEAAEALERAGCRVSKSGGYYRDEAAVYRLELRRRRVFLFTVVIASDRIGEHDPNQTWVGPGLYVENRIQRTTQWDRNVERSWVESQAAAEARREFGARFLRIETGRIL